MALHFLLHHTRDGYRAYRCRSLNKQIMCQINFEVYGNSSNKYFNHESSNFMLSGNRRRGRQKAKKKQQKKHSQDSRGCILRMLVAQREHHRQESVPTRHTLAPMSLTTWLYNILRYIGKCGMLAKYEYISPGSTLRSIEGVCIMHALRQSPTFGVQRENYN